MKIIGYLAYTVLYLFIVFWILLYGFTEPLGWGIFWGVSAFSGIGLLNFLRNSTCSKCGHNDRRRHFGNALLVRGSSEDGYAPVCPECNYTCGEGHVVWTRKGGFTNQL